MTLADDLLEAARGGVKHRGPLGWLERLSAEHCKAIEKTREDWVKIGGKSSGVSAARLAAVICERMTALGYQMPREKAVADWLLKS
jgi:hypothetical protein